MYLSILDHSTSWIFSPKIVTQSIALRPKMGVWPVSRQRCLQVYDSCLTTNAGITTWASNWAIWPWQVAGLSLRLDSYNICGLLNQLFVQWSVCLKIWAYQWSKREIIKDGDPIIGRMKLATVIDPWFYRSKRQQPTCVLANLRAWAAITPRQPKTNSRQTTVSHARTQTPCLNVVQRAQFVHIHFPRFTNPPVDIV